MNQFRSLRSARRLAFSALCSALALVVACSAFFAKSAIAENLGEDLGWIGDFDLAAEKAAEEGKPLLVVFTGTAWIDLSRNFYDEILSKSALLDAVGEKLVLVKLEFPEEGSAPERFDELRETYGVRGFPMVVLVGVDHRPFGINGYQPIGPDAYAEQILSIYEANERRIARASEARHLVGKERAEALFDGLPDLPPELLVGHYREDVEIFLESDPDNETGKAEGVWRLLVEYDYHSRMRGLAEDVQWSRMIELTQEHIEKLQLRGEPLQRALLNIASVQERQQNLPGRIQTLIGIVNVVPESEYGLEAQRQLDLLRVEKLQSELAP